MLGLARMAEERQREAKQEIEKLLAKRSELERVNDDDAVSGNINKHLILVHCCHFLLVKKDTQRINCCWQC